MGKWRSNNMQSLDGELFEEQGKHMEQLIMYNYMVTKVVYTWVNHQQKSVKVHGVITSSGEKFKVEGWSVILTVPLNVLLGIKIESKISTEPFPKDFAKAIENVSNT